MRAKKNIGDVSLEYEDWQSIHPTKIVRRVSARRLIYTQVNASGVPDDNGGHLMAIPEKIKRAGNPKLSRSYHNFEVSKNSQKNIQAKCNWLWRLAQSRTVRTYNGKMIYNFRNSFLTFTLPSTQVHPTSEILTECWEKLLTQFRNVLKMHNYVWKLEFQENGNLHFHLITDTYIDYFYARRAWNVLVNKLGYVDEYHKKFVNMAFAEYRQLFSAEANKDVQKLASWYEKGRRSNWMNPNSVDVRNVTNEKTMGYYLSKYIAKSGVAGGHPTLDNEGNSFGLRLAFWSRSLSKCVAVSMPLEAFDFDIENIYDQLGGVVKKAYDYCRIFYFRISEMTNEGKRWFYSYFTALRHEFDFIPAR